MGNNSFVKIIIGSGVAILMSILLLLIIAILLAYTNVPESIIAPSIIIVSALSILVGSLLSSIRIRKQGIINGGIVGRNLHYYFVFAI